MGIIHPEDPKKLIWNAVVALATIAALVLTPLTLVFDFSGVLWVVLVDIWINVVFIVDIVLTFFTGYLVGGKLITDPTLIRRKYLRGWFALDLLASLPLFLLPGVQFAYLNKALRFFRLLRILKIFNLFRMLNHMGSSRVRSNYLKLVLMLFWLAMGAHIIACGFLLVRGIEIGDSPVLSYIQALYWTTTTLATIGYGDITPNKEDMVQVLYTIMAQILGVGMYGYVIGNITSVIASIDISKTQFVERMEKVNTMLAYRNISPELGARIKLYYEHLWESRKGYDESGIFETLPKNLKIEIAQELHRDILAKVPLFAEAPDHFIREVVLNLVPLVFTPGDTIVKEGENGDEMYFINHGSVAAVSGDGTKTYATLGAGSYFGEIALVFPGPRTATIRALDYCDLYSLAKPALDKILLRYPAMAKQMEQRARERMAAQG